MSHDKLNTHSSDEEKSTLGQKVAGALAIAGYIASTAALNSHPAERSVFHGVGGDGGNQTLQLEKAEKYDEYYTITAEADGTRYDAVRQVYPEANFTQVFDLVWSTINVTAEKENRADKHEVHEGDEVEVPKVDFIVAD